MRRSDFAYAWLVTFTVVLALVIGWRLPAESRHLVAGVLAGVAASLPTSLLVAWLAARAHARARPPRPAWPAGAPPRPLHGADLAPAAFDE